MGIPNDITTNHILQSLEEIDQIELNPRRQSTKFDLYHNNKRYPPKEVLRFANRIANDNELVEFGGGDETNNFLINLGFEVVLKDTDISIGLDYTKKNQQGTDYFIQGFNNEREYAAVDQDKIVNDDLSITEKEQLIKSRIGHSIFKEGLIKRECKCLLCGVTDKRLLIASHIKPWSQSDDKERLDLNNGFLFCPNHDALFDKGFITFNENGEIIISKQIDEYTKLFLNIRDGIQIEVNDRQRLYLKWHMNFLFER
ncbi:HNH endonuclease [Niallia circulans]|uniref:HNH endonuclease n=1 Tax=Niallia circulans TaxID=1397 RepID=UPI0006A0009B|nr:HNH endonuclease [Niallia circulans]